MRTSLYVLHNKASVLNHIASKCIYVLLESYTHTQMYTHWLSVTSTKAGMSQSSLERIIGLGLCVHVALSASLFTFPSIHIKAFLSSFA